MLDLHCQLIMDEFEEKRPVFERMEEIVSNHLRKLISDKGIYVNAVESRVKSAESLEGKLLLKGKNYSCLSDITDILGCRVVTFYVEEVDKIAAMVESVFDIDWEQSVDKRKKLDLDQFGYQSLHYICRIPKSLYCDASSPELNEFRFEIQMRTALQHVWASMHHDTGYKSGVEVPKEYLRSLNRLAGLLELADEQFSRIRTEINDYRRQVQSLVADGNFDAVVLNGDSFKSYMQLNPFKSLIDKVAGINQAEVYQDDLTPYLQAFLRIGCKTLGDIERIRRECSEDAYQLSLHQLACTDLDIIAQSVVLQNLCVVYMAKQGCNEKMLCQFFDVVNGENGYNATRAKRMAEQLQNLKFAE